MPIIKTVTLRTIALELGLSVETVYKALKGKPGMSETTRQLVVKTAENLGYFTKEQVLSLRADRVIPFSADRKRFLLLTTSPSNNFYSLLLQGLRERFTTLGHHIDMLQLPSKIKAASMREWMDDNGLEFTDGLFVAPNLIPQEWEPNLLQLKVPIILLGYPKLGTRVDSVIWDIYEATFLAVDYLRSIGHRNIMYVGDTNRQHRGYVLRWLAFLHAMDEFRAGVNPEFHSIGDRSVNIHWLEELREKLIRNSPTAIICGIDGEVPAVFKLITELGLRIPDDISLIGLLNEQPELLPPFTMPLLAIRETGYRAADRMLWRIANPSLPYEHIRIHGELLIGSTTSVNNRA
ncbi:MAG: hypothetical protein K0Q59_1685 [Paenibacillus sp.]|nr:hypothetical protein [Paenibacillus sp.]